MMAWKFVLLGLAVSNYSSILFYDCFMKFLEPLVRGLIGLRHFLINEAVLTKMNLLDAPHPADMVMPIASIVSGNHMRSTGRHDPSEHNSLFGFLGRCQKQSLINIER